MSVKRPEGRLRSFAGRLWRGESRFGNLLPLLVLAGLAGTYTAVDHATDGPQRRLEKRLFRETARAYLTDSQSVCAKKGPFFQKESSCNYLLVQGSDSRERFMRAFRADMRIMKGLLESQGCQVETVCSDTHSVDDLNEAYGALASKSSPDSLSGIYFTGHGVRRRGQVFLQFNKEVSGSGDDKKASDNLGKAALIGAETLNLVLGEIKGDVRLIHDNCYSLDELVKGTRIESSDESTASYIAGHVDVSYFTLALAYSMSVRGSAYSLEDTARHLAVNDPSLPQSVRSLIERKNYAFNSISVRDAKSRPARFNRQKKPFYIDVAKPLVNSGNICRSYVSVRDYSRVR